MQYTHPFNVDYKNPVVLGYLGFDLISGDGGTDVIEATITDDGVAADLSTPAVATLYVVREDLSTVVTAMNIVGNAASVAIPVEATAIIGRAVVMVRVAVTGIARTVLKRYTDVRDGITGVIVDPGDTIPSLDALLAAVAAVEDATDLANAAAAAITGITAEAETLTTSDVPTAVAEIDPGDGHINLALGFPRPRLRHTGTAITGTSDTPTVYATGITYAMAGDEYAYNGATEADIGNIYVCSLGGDAATALWAYDRNDRGAAGAAITTASEMPIVDVGNRFTSTEVEGALQEVGAKLETVYADYVVCPEGSVSGVYLVTGAFVASAEFNFKTINVVPTEKIKYTGMLWTPSWESYPISNVVFLNAAGSVLGYDAAATASVVEYTDREVVIPALCTKVYVNGDILHEATPYTFSVSIKKTVYRAALAATNDLRNTVNSDMVHGEAISPTWIDGMFDTAGTIYSGTGWNTKYLTIENPDLNGYILTRPVSGYGYAAYRFDCTSGIVYSGDVAFDEEYLAIPFDCTQIYIQVMSWQTADPTFKLSLPSPALRSRVKAIEAKSVVSESHWYGKKIVWFGTSIPTSGYPEKVGELLGATVVNEAIGASMARAGDYEYPASTTYPILCMSMSVAEKQAASWYAGLSTEVKAQADASAYDAILDPHLGAGNRADLYVFDHGHNDTTWCGDDAENMMAIPATPFDKTYFIGAMNFLINRILEDNPRAQIAFIGHYESDRKSAIYKGQEALAAIWGFPLCKSWEILGFSQNEVLTTGFWTGTGLSSVWTASGGSPQTLTMTEIWMQDDLHPHSDVASTYIAKKYAKFIDGIYAD